MEAAPLFEEFIPESDCDCPGCIHRRRTTAHALPRRLGGHPAAHGARRALVLAAAAGTVLGGQTLPAVASAEVGGRPAGPEASPADDGGPGTPQGTASPLYGRPGVGLAGPPGASGVRAITRTEIINRAKAWVAEKVPYSMEKYRPDGYRQDCSGFVSMAWNLGGNEWTGSLDTYATRIAKDQLQPGDILLFHNPANPTNGSHVTIFGGWTDYTRTHYLAYEQARPHARKQSTPYGYWTYKDRYVPYRHKGVGVGPPAGSGPAATAPTDVGSKVTQGDGGAGSASSGGAGVPAYPGRGVFRPGQSHPAIERLGRQLVRKGFGRYYTRGPGPSWSESDRRNVEAFQRSQGWRGAAADGFPGPETWRRLFR